MTLTNKTALITGASRGIGAAAAAELAAAGANVVLTARSSDAIEANADGIKSAGGKALALTCDVADYEQVTDAVTRAEEAFGPLDILVNNAGVIEPVARITDSDPVEWGRVIDINVKGVFHGVRAALPGMEKRGQGTIIIIGSGAAHGALNGWSHYAASKAAVLNLSRAIHTEAHEAGVISINLSPGTVATQMQRDIAASGVDNVVTRMDWSRHKPPEWVGQAIVWLSGPDGAGYAGEEVRLDPDVLAHMGIGPSATG